MTIIAALEIIAVIHRVAPALGESHPAEAMECHRVK